MASQRVPFVCASCSRSLKSASARTASQRSSQLTRNSPFSTTSIVHDEELFPSSSSTSSTAEFQPRWKQTPPGMRQPVRLRPLPRQPIWKVNNEQEPLDQMYDRFLGRALGGSITGREALPEDIKWIAITHKSYEQGAQGFNDKLAFLGKRIVDLQTTLALHRSRSFSSSSSAFFNEDPDATHPDLEGIENLSLVARQRLLDRARLANVAAKYGVQQVMRWKPRKSDNLMSSGIQTVAAHTLYAIVGALAMHRGGEVATTVARERILQPLGLR